MNVERLTDRYLKICINNIRNTTNMQVKLIKNVLTWLSSIKNVFNNGFSIDKCNTSQQ